MNSESNHVCVLAIPDFGNSNLTIDQIPRGPYFMSEPINQVVVDDTVSLELDCFCEGNPQPYYQWFMNSAEDDNDFNVNFSEVSISCVQ